MCLVPKAYHLKAVLVFSRLTVNSTVDFTQNRNIVKMLKYVLKALSPSLHR